MVKHPLILIVDHESGFAKLLKLRLESAGFSAKTASTGAAALLEAQEAKPDIMILNTALPDTSGLDLWRRIKEHPELESTPVLFLAERGEYTKELESKQPAVITKPYDPKSLLAHIDKALHRHRKVPKRKVLPSKEVSAEVAKINLRGISIDSELAEKIPAKFVEFYRFMPIKLEKDVLTIAVNRPYELRLKDDLRQLLGYELEMVCAETSDIEEKIKQFYGVGTHTVEQILAETNLEELMKKIEASEEREEDITKIAEDASVIKLVNQILIEAQEKNSTDVHIEPYQGELRLRYRIDGVLNDAKVSPHMRHLFPAIISRMKIMSGLNIVERRLPQDGKAKVKIKNEIVDLRISTLPTPYGESMVIRVLPTKRLQSLEDLGLSGQSLEIFEGLIQEPHGIIFVTGPTGSGKTTTLYTCLTKIKAENTGAKILTIEDPIEYELEGITQIQVNPEIDLTFARGLRSMLRHDPDIMMVGEVRDMETAEIAIRMALTGHLLFSTLHTNDAASGVARLLDVGVEPYLVASSVLAFIAQRLVRAICSACKEKAKKGDSYRGRGCEACNGTGYKGRSALFEILLVDESIRQLIMKKVPSDEIKRQAVAHGMKTLWDSGQEKIAKGITTLEEVLRVTTQEE